MLLALYLSITSLSVQFNPFSPKFSLLSLTKFNFWGLAVILIILNDGSLKIFITVTE